MKTDLLLGFGMMRLPHRGVGIDIEKTKEMVDAFMAAGGTYFDTAFVYPGSEDAVRRSLVERYPRESYTIATKLFASLVPTENAAKKELETSLSRTGAGYVDYYLLHALDDRNYTKYDKFHLWDFVREKQAQGLIRSYGFSFHGTPEVLDKILTDHPDADFVQLQLNYADWENPKVRSRECYEVARKHGKDIVVMEPVKGGALADPPQAVKDLLEPLAPGASPASWALRFTASLDGIRVILSGMSTLDQVKDNLATFKDFTPLTGEEQAAIRRASEVFHRQKTIPCTACRYCTEGCPQKISIPDVFAARNEQIGSGRIEKGRENYRILTEKTTPADRCIACGRCEATCPQGLEIISLLKDCVDHLK